MVAGLTRRGVALLYTTSSVSAYSCETVGSLAGGGGEDMENAVSA